MRWQDGRRSDNVEDQRGFGVKHGVIGGGIGILLILAVGLLTGTDPLSMLGAVMQGSGSVDNSPPVLTAAENQSADFVSVVLADTEDTWSAIFAKKGMVYTKPKLVLFKGSVESQGYVVPDSFTHDTSAIG